MTTITESTSTAAVNPLLGGTVQEYRWTWENRPLKIIYESVGEGEPLLLLPAFSTVSSRTEWAGITPALAEQFQAIALDWPGFGQSSRLPFDYNPSLFQQFLHDFVKDVCKSPTTVIAAGHAAGYAMQLAQSWSKIILVAPTWRGPLRVMGAPKPVAKAVRETVRSPFLGQMLYALNTHPAFLRFMYRSHVFASSEILTADFMQQKWQSTQQPGARFAPAAFVTGNLDPVETTADFQALFASVSAPILVVIGEQAPTQSKAEMEALAALPNVQTVRLPGALGLHEEYPTELKNAIAPFLGNA